MSIPTGAGFFGEPVVLTVIGALLAFGVLFWWTHREQLPGASAHARGAEPARARTACTMRVLRGTAEPSAPRAPAPRPAPTATAALPAASSSAGAGVSASDDDDDANEGSGGSESSASVDADVDDEIDSEEDVLLVMREWGTRGQATRCVTFRPFLTATRRGGGSRSYALAATIQTAGMAGSRIPPSHGALLPTAARCAAHLKVLLS